MTTEQLLIVTLLYPTLPEVEALHTFDREWFLRQQHQMGRSGSSVIATYVRDSSALEVYSTWDIAYRLIEMLLAVSEDRGGQRIRVRLHFSEIAHDETELTGTELLVESPCICERLRVGEEVNYFRQEEEGLEVPPHITSLVSEENLKPWMTWLPEQCELRGRCNGVTFGSVNCNSIIFQDRVIRNFGYHGRVVFYTLACPRCAHRMLKRWKHQRATLDRIRRR